MRTNVLWFCVLSVVALSVLSFLESHYVTRCAAIDAQFHREAKAHYERGAARLDLHDQECGRLIDRCKAHAAALEQREAEVAERERICDAIIELEMAAGPLWKLWMRFLSAL